MALRRSRSESYGFLVAFSFKALVPRQSALSASIVVVDKESDGSPTICLSAASRRGPSPLSIILSTDTLKDGAE